MDADKVKQTLKRYLPDHELTYCEVEDHEILGMKFQNAGVAARLHDNLDVFGASSSFTESPLMFAAYELLERFAILSRPIVRHELDSDTFRSSISNGVAIHKTIEEAKMNAQFELLERNEILKSWYFNTPVEHLPVSSLGEMSAEAHEHYEFALVDFSTIQNVHVIGVFAFPKNPSVNLVYGFGSASDLHEAILKAKKEFITRLGFLWGESFEEEVPVNTPDFHQNFYLRPENLCHIKEWLFGSLSTKKSLEKYQLKDMDFVNITPLNWGGDFFVVRAQSHDVIPLFFGQPPKQLFDFPFRCDIPHPIM